MGSGARGRPATLRVCWCPVDSSQPRELCCLVPREDATHVPGHRDARGDGQPPAELQCPKGKDGPHPPPALTAGTARPPSPIFHLPVARRSGSNAGARCNGCMAAAAALPRRLFTGSGAAPLRCPARPAGGAVRGWAGRGRSGAAVGGGRWAAGGRARRRQRLWAPRGAAPGAVRPPAGSAVSPVHGTAMEVVDETEALQRFFEGTAGGGQTFADRGLLQRCGLRAAAVRLREPAGPGAGRAESRDRRALRLLHAAPSERPGPSGCASGSQRTKLLRPAPWAPRPLAVGGAPGTAAPSFCLWRWDFCLSRSSVPQDGGFPSVSWVVW